MTQSNGNPVARLFALPVITGPGNPVTGPAVTAPATGSPAVPVTAPVSAVATGLLPVPLSTGERTRRTITRWAGTAAGAVARLRLNPGRLIRTLIHAAPDRTSAHWGYVKSGEWVPRGLRGTRKGKAIAFSGWAYHVFAIAADKALQGLECALQWLAAGVRKTRWAVQRPLRLLAFAVPVVVLLFIVT
jgi:hypothetical protein